MRMDEERHHERVGSNPPRGGDPANVPSTCACRGEVIDAGRAVLEDQVAGAGAFFIASLVQDMDAQTPSEVSKKPTYCTYHNMVCYSRPPHR